MTLIRLVDLRSAAHSAAHADQQRLPDLTTLRLALARIRTRKLSGEARIGAYLRQIQLTNADMVQLSHRLNDIDNRPLEVSDGGEVFQEFVELLYSMRKKGERFPILVNSLKLSGAEAAKLHGATVSPLQEAQIELDYLASRKFMNIEDNKLVYHVVQLGPFVGNAVLEKLRVVAQHPENYRNGGGFAAIFSAASKLNDRRAVPVFRVLEGDSNRRISGYATIARLNIEKGTSSGPELP